MKILSFLNVSNIDNLECDSGFIFQKLLGRSIIERGHEFVLVLPPCNVTVLPGIRFHNFGTDKFQVRFSFSWSEIKKILVEERPDTIICNQPELASNLRAVLISEALPIKLFTYVHYFPFSFDQGSLEYDPSLNNDNFGASIVLSFLSGLLASDRILVHSRFAENLTAQLFNHYGHGGRIPPISILPPPYDENLLIERNVQSRQKKTILYNHRLYKQYGTDFLVDFAKLILNRPKWHILITDLLFNRSGKRVSLDGSVDGFRQQLSEFPNVSFRTDGNDRRRYAEIISNSDVSIAPYRMNCTWSMSVIDCMSLGVPVLAPDIAWFKEFIPTDLLFKGSEGLVDKLDILFANSVHYETVSGMVKGIVLNEQKLGRRQVATKLFDIIGAS